MQGFIEHFLRLGPAMLRQVYQNAGYKLEFTLLILADSVLF
jgi:hypothetical protein